MTISRIRKSIVASVAIASMVVAGAPAGAVIVYDPTNYAQNVIQAARALEQINNQIRSLQNQATSLLNDAKNLTTLPLTVFEPLQQQIRQTQQLLNQAQNLGYDVKQIDQEFATKYKSIDLNASQKTLVNDARSRWTNSVGAFEDALKVQAGAVGNIEGSRSAMKNLVTASQSASGALQAAQAGNQMMALQSQQLADLTATMASIGRAQSLDAAQKAAAQAQGREQLRRFMGGGKGYVPVKASMFPN
ncbi:P-type conjugative transfer protein TrbJ [Sphingorhabdus sp. YGSMI21]|uniref:P-type conjugative transfer protein TrbJ n=1 Tax=Sphingorhabdus sp. YGSMI21 TaxID=2077182 RepID=UPI000C1F58C4|nr:P-type conjugative transfer protein TrbJ [Sphingorhabdus sp. YGSMI21]ATW05285.1 P-type conjugative transfer protein TrbJ [Sphingorhabdus sp. YGSMI21]